MPAHYFDTSAFAKRYHREPGTAAVLALLAGPGPHFICRLGWVETRSAFAKKVRAGQMTANQYVTVRSAVRADVRAGLVGVIEMRRRDYARAARLIDAVGLRQNLRSLDALQLAVALRLRAAHPGLVFVSADQALLATAAGQGLATAHV